MKAKSNRLWQQRMYHRYGAYDVTMWHLIINVDMPFENNKL